jgi:hypothetical protein
MLRRNDTRCRKKINHMDTLALKCPRCLTENPFENNYCTKCGFQMKEIPPSSSLFKQITIYLISFFLPPFGLIPAIKYLRQNDPKLKQIGLIAIIITFISIFISIYTGIILYNELSRQVNQELQNLSF